MILSYHPCFTGDENRLCAGRRPDASDLARIRCADAVILPQGVQRPLYDMAVRNCRHVFPDYTARFAYPGKSGQIRLFREICAPHPETRVFAHLQQYGRQFPGGRLPDGLSFPCIFKFDWGGEGENVMLLRNPDDLKAALSRAQAFEETGQCGFLIQRFIPCRSRSLRVVVMDQKLLSYWRIQSNPQEPLAGLAAGAAIDRTADAGRQAAGRAQVREFCTRAGINLAGFDLLAPETDGEMRFLEINYFFGRRGLGGSAAFYQMLGREIGRWLHRRGLSRSNPQGSETHEPV
jgi:ribosomal protein S6--L-glutamate ligase